MMIEEPLLQAVPTAGLGSDKIRLEKETPVCLMKKKKERGGDLGIANVSYESREQLGNIRGNTNGPLRNRSR